jgi:hypothetical protein
LDKKNAIALSILQAKNKEAEALKEKEKTVLISEKVEHKNITGEESLA